MSIDSLRQAFEQNLDRIVETRTRYADGPSDPQPSGPADFETDPLVQLRAETADRL